MRGLVVAGVVRGDLGGVLGVRRGKMGQIYLYRRNFIGGFYGASEMFLRPRKTQV